MKLGMEVGLGPGHIVSDVDPAPPPQRGTAPIFGPCLLWPNGWMDQDATWYEGRPRLRPHCVTWGPISPPKKERGTAPQFSAHAYCGQMVAHLSTAEYLLIFLCFLANKLTRHITYGKLYLQVGK